MSTASEITPAETNPNDPPSVNHNPSQSQPSQLENNEKAKQDPKADRQRRALRFPTFRELFTSKGKRSGVHVNKFAVKRMIIQEKDVLSSLISADINYIKKSTLELDKYKDKVSDRVAEAERRLDELNREGDESTEKDYWELKKAVTKLKLHVPVNNVLNEAKGQRHGQQSIGVLEAKPGQKIPAKVLEKLPQLHRSRVLENSPDFKEFKARYNELSTEMKLCLLCFSVFPEDVIIKKRLMVYWWIAEGFVPPADAKAEIENGKTAEDFGNEYFYELMRRGFIEPANKKRSISVKTCRMNPLIRSTLVLISENAKFFNFDSKGEPVENFLGSLRACLVGNGLLKYEDLRKGQISVEDLEKLHLVFNVNENFLEFKTEWFLKMKNVNMLYLGRWKVLATDHIEVEETEFLDGLEIMKYLKFFSLQGVSRITDLPESLTKLKNLKILDVRACHSLETIPKDIGLLKNLTHLDVSECYLLQHIPKSLAMLLELRVLKGFVIESEQDKNSCTLEDLRKLEKLNKLSIYTGLQEFPTEEHVRALQNLQALRKLTITWGGGALHAPEDRGKDTKEKTSAEQAKAQAKTKGKEGNKHLKKDNRTAEQANAKSETQETQAASSRPSHDNQDHAEDKKKNSTEVDELKALSAKNAGQDSTDNTAAEQSKVQAKAQKPQAASLGRLNAFKGGSWNLEKLDLKCYPTTTALAWLTPSSFTDLKKLYIRGGKFSDLGQYQDFLGSYLPKEMWDVEILRLKYLNELEMDWRELQELFPQLIYLEKVCCPKLSFFPCDATGVWINKDKLKKSDYKTAIIFPSHSY